MRKSEENDPQEHAQWAQHVAKVMILSDLFQTLRLVLCAAGPLKSVFCHLLFPAWAALSPRAGKTHG
jgi:hypothetical protein